LYDQEVLHQGQRNTFYSGDESIYADMMSMYQQHHQKDDDRFLRKGFLDQFLAAPAGGHH
jgi:hypothetical protein